MIKQNKLKKIENDLVKVINKKSKKKINLTTNLIREEIVDSLFLIEIVSFLEKKHKVIIPTNKISVEDFKSIKNLILLIKKITG